jgi:hypothetical protein
MVELPGKKSASMTKTNTTLRTILLVLMTSKDWLLKIKYVMAEIQQMYLKQPIWQVMSRTILLRGSRIKSRIQICCKSNQLHISIHREERFCIIMLTKTSHPYQAELSPSLLIQVICQLRWYNLQESKEISKMQVKLEVKFKTTTTSPMKKISNNLQITRHINKVFRCQMVLEAEITMNSQVLISLQSRFKHKVENKI